MPTAEAAMFRLLKVEESVNDAGATCGEEVTSLVVSEGWNTTSV